MFIVCGKEYVIFYEHPTIQNGNKVLSSSYQYKYDDYKKL